MYYAVKGIYEVDNIKIDNLILLFEALGYRVFSKNFKYGKRMTVTETDEAITLNKKIVPHQRYKEFYLRVSLKKGLKIGIIESLQPLDVTKQALRMSEKKEYSLVEAIQYTFNKEGNTHREHYEEDARIRYKENILFMHYRVN